jgi:hypothetical protein
MMQVGRGRFVHENAALVASCVPYQPGPYQQGSYQQRPYQQGSSGDESEYDESSGYPPNAGNTGNAGNAGDSGAGEWSCRAVGTYAPGSSDGSGPDYSAQRNFDITKWGRTRDEAGIAAIDTCSDLLHLAANSTLSPGSLVIEPCRALSCSPPSR